jgi:hypothetical protein
MKHGLFIFPTDYSIDPGSLARMAEDAGFESIYLLPSVTRTEVEPLLEAILAAASVVDAG